MSTETTELSVPDQIKVALDGRTQRWLCFNAKIAESDLSRKMNGKEPFTKDELQRINDLLNSTITAAE